MKYQNFFYRILVFTLGLCIGQIASAQILFIQNQQHLEKSNIIKKNLLDKMLLPKELIHQRKQQDCKTREEDQIQFDLVICLEKKNGELIFPVSKNSILKESYKSFL